MNHRVYALRYRVYALSYRVYALRYSIHDTGRNAIYNISSLGIIVSKIRQ